MKKLVFFTHASEQVGFGHLSRCLKISKILSSDYRNKDFRIYFNGEINNSIKSWIKKNHKINFNKIIRPDLAIYDRMDDHRNPENIDNKYFSEIKERSKKTILFANGKKLPEAKLLNNTLVIGYKITNKIKLPNNVFWDLKYAPVNIKKSKNSLKNNILIALGGYKGSANIAKVLKAISFLNSVKTIDFLQSPVNIIDLKKEILSDKQTLRIHKNVKNIESLICNAGIIITSYGHLAYEAIACGKPTCLLNQKVFQNIYADDLSDEKLCINAGLIKKLSIEQIGFFLNKTIRQTNIIKANIKNKIDGKGLIRISKIILKQLV